MSQVLDYSAGFPGAKAIKNAGYGGAVRYIGFPDRRKCTTREELADFMAHGLGMALVFENNTRDWRGGFDQGSVSGHMARAHAHSIGFPADRPIYMAVDEDVVKLGEFATMIEYLRGAGTSLGGAYVTGVYGEADVIDRARDAGVAEWFWQTAAWSRGRRTSAHLFQRVGRVEVGGIACDINDVLSLDWGQHNAIGDSMGAVEELQAVQVTGPDGVKRGGLDHLVQGARWSAEAVHAADAARIAAVARLDALTAAVAAIHVDPAVDVATLTAIINDATPDAQDVAAEIMPGLVTQVTAKLQAALVEVLGADNEDQAAEIVRLVAAKLAAA